LLAQWGEVKQYQAQFIAHLIGFDFSHSSHLVGILHDAGQIRNRAFHYFADYLRVLVSQSDYPIILLLEDVHWADSGSLELVNYLALECTALPLLIIATAQPTLKEIHPQWSKQTAAFK